MGDNVFVASGKLIMTCCIIADDCEIAVNVIVSSLWSPFWLSIDVSHC